MKSEPIPTHTEYDESPYLTVDDLSAISEKATTKLAQVRQRMLDPDLKKQPPSFTLAKLAALCGVGKDRIRWRLAKDKDRAADDDVAAAESGSDARLPTGRMVGNRIEFDLAETQRWVRHVRASYMRPAGKRGIVISIANFKGGSSKSTTAMTLAQAMTLRGYRVLAIDLDPQGTLTTFFGILPGAEVDPDATAIRMCTEGKEVPDFADIVIRDTQQMYWSNLHLIPASPGLSGAEFMLPANWSKDRTPFWDRLTLALEPLRDEYDVIIIDTPPSLGYLTINALYAADGLVIPVPPKAMDFASLSQFWTLFSQLFTSIERSRAQLRQAPKVFDFAKVLLSIVDTNDGSTEGVKDWILATYANMVMPVEIPKTAVTSSSSAKFGTVYDVKRYAGKAETYVRAKVAYDRVAEIIEQAIVERWKRPAQRRGDAGHPIATLLKEPAHG